LTEENECHNDLEKIISFEGSRSTSFKMMKIIKAHYLVSDYISTHNSCAQTRKIYRVTY